MSPLEYSEYVAAIAIALDLEDSEIDSIPTPIMDKLVTYWHDEVA